MTLGATDTPQPTNKWKEPCKPNRRKTRKLKRNPSSKFVTSSQRKTPQAGTKSRSSARRLARSGKPKEPHCGSIPRCGFLSGTEGKMWKTKQSKKKEKNRSKSKDPNQKDAKGRFRQISDLSMADSGQKRSYSNWRGQDLKRLRYPKGGETRNRLWDVREEHTKRASPTARWHLNTNRRVEATG